MEDFNSAVGGALLVGDRDETRLTQKVTLADGRDTQNVTTFQPGGNASSYAYLLLSGTIAAMGFTDEAPDAVKAELASVMASRGFKPVVLFGKNGLAPGTEANFARCLVSTKNAERSLTGVTSADATFATDGSGILDGVSLHAVFGEATPNLSEIQKLTFNSADPSAFRGVRARGTTQVFSFGLGIDNAALAAGIAGLPAYNGRQVTVTGAALTGATNKSGVRQIAYDGTVDVPQIEAVSGITDSFILANGDGGNYSVNGGENFTLPITEGALETNQRNLGGQFAGVVVKKSAITETVAGQFTISGAGTAAANGTYTDFGPGPDAGTREYRSATGYRLYRSGGQWVLRGPDNGDRYLQTLGTPVSDYPVLHEVFIGNATAPVPTISGTGIGTPASADFNFYYPLSATPAAPVATGTGATITRVPLGTSPDVAASTTQQSTGANVDFAYNVVTATGAGEWIDTDTVSDDGFSLALSLIHKQGDGATLKVIVETADADGAGQPVAGSVATLYESQPLGERGARVVSGAQPVKRLVRARHVVIGGGEFIFGVALAAR